MQSKTEQNGRLAYSGHPPNRTEPHTRLQRAFAKCAVLGNDYALYYTS